MRYPRLPPPPPPPKMAPVQIPETRYAKTADGVPIAYQAFGR